MEAGYDYLLLRGRLQRKFLRYSGLIIFVFGALLLGKSEGGVLRYCGSVGTGFKVADLAEVYAQVQKWHTQECPFPTSPNEPKLFSYLEPRLQVDVKYHERTPDGKLRFPVFLRLRPDLLEAP